MAMCLRLNIRSLDKARIINSISNRNINNNLSINSPTAWHDDLASTAVMNPDITVNLRKARLLSIIPCLRLLRTNYS